MDKTAENQYIVKETDTAKAIGSGGLPVLSTPHMAAYMENTAWKMLEFTLDDTQTSVGIEMNLTHSAPTAVGKQVDVKATLLELTKNIYTFHIEAHVEGKRIGKAEHKRAVVQIERFMSSISRK